MTPRDAPLRILAVCNQWQGANDYAFVRAFRSLGHSVRVVDPRSIEPNWQSTRMRIVRRLLKKQIAEEFSQRLYDEAVSFRPDLLFVFKGSMITGETLAKIKDLGTINIQFYPDTGFEAQSVHIRSAIPHYHWFFSTKPEHVELLPREMNYTTVSFLPHAFDPETHVPTPRSPRDEKQYGCDVSFIGDTSAKKISTLQHVVAAHPDLDIRIWGPTRWTTAPAELAKRYQGAPVFGAEYAKAIGASRINIGLLYEGNKGAGADVITARTFEIPAAGGFMMHEKTTEVARLFKDAEECVLYSDAADLSEKIGHYVGNPDLCKQIADNARERCVSSGYSTVDRAKTVIAKYFELSETSGSAPKW